MNYRIYELLFFLFCYSFLGWCAEVIFMAARTGRFTNRGLFNVPFSLSYGVAMDILLLLQPTMAGNYLLLAVIYVVITSAVAQIAGEITWRVTKTRLWELDEKSLYAGRLRGFFSAVFLALCALVAMLLIQPLLFFLVKIIPKLVLRIVTLDLSALALVDFITVFMWCGGIRCHRVSWGWRKVSKDSRRGSAPGFPSVSGSVCVVPIQISERRRAVRKRTGATMSLRGDSALTSMCGCSLPARFSAISSRCSSWA
ncbi:MAG: putative ABC transporter permease [Lachnospiraceae bacterium]|nr:putative ABC transporter permease [Lachnospiraceae bacterium]